MRLIGSCITQLKAQGPSRTCNESKEEEEAVVVDRIGFRCREFGFMVRGLRFTLRDLNVRAESWKVDIRLPGKGNSNSHGARPVHLIITMIKWFRSSRLSIKNYLSPGGSHPPQPGDENEG